MTIENDFILFGSTSTNIDTQSSYAADPNTAGGRPSGIWPSVKANKTLRQATYASKVLADLIVTYTSQPVIDDGTVATFETNLIATINAIAIANANNIVSAGTSEVQSIAIADAANIVTAGASTVQSIAIADAANIVTAGAFTVESIAITNANNIVAAGILEVQSIAVADAANIVSAGTSKVQSIAVADANNIVAAAGGVQTLWIPASAMQPDATTYPAANKTQFGTNKFTLNALSFTNGVADLAYFTIAMPTNWNANTIYAQFFWYGVAGSGNVVFGLACADIANGGSLDAAFGTPQTVSSAYVGVNDLVVSGDTSAITISGTPTAGNLVEFKVYRSSSDSFSSVANLIGLRIYYGTIGVFG